MLLLVYHVIMAKNKITCKSTRSASNFTHYCAIIN